MTYWTIIYITAGLLTLYLLYVAVTSFRKANDKQKSKLLKIFVAVIAVSVLLFWGIRASNISETLFPATVINQGVLIIE